MKTVKYALFSGAILMLLISGLLLFSHSPEIATSINNSPLVAKAPDEMKPVIPAKTESEKKEHPKASTTKRVSKTPDSKLLLPVGENPTQIANSIDYISKSQKPSGGWGSGTLNNYSTNVRSDPGTTSLVSLSLIRCGYSFDDDTEKKNPLRKALRFMLNVMKLAGDKEVSISNDKNAQPQMKIGRNTDLCFASMFFSRAIPMMRKTDSLYQPSVDAAKDCIRRIEKSQGKNGSWSDVSWAPIFQTTLCYTALDYSQKAGLKVNSKAMENARDFIIKDVEAGAGFNGFQLYKCSGAMRMLASEKLVAERMIEENKRIGVLPEDANLNVENLVLAGVSDSRANKLISCVKTFDKISEATRNNSFLMGFGSYGGEEFLSYFLISEASVIGGNEALSSWTSNLLQRLESIKNGNGSFEGQHCITAPIFCTAAAVLALTAQKDKEFLARSGKAEIGL